MRILLDECVDWRLLRDLNDHDVKTVRQMGWTSTADGGLLRLAQDAFDVFITTDKNLSFQQTIARFEIAVIVLSGRSDRLRHLRDLLPAMRAALAAIRPGELRTVAWTDLP